MFCSFCGIGDAQESICDNCVAEKDVNESSANQQIEGWWSFSGKINQTGR